MADGQVALETERLILREMVEDDLEALLKFLGDAEAMVHYPAPFTQERVSDWISWSRRNYAEHGFGLWAMVLKATGDVIGDCGLTWQRVGYSPERQLEAGWHLRRDLWGQGLATEAGRACRDHAQSLGYRHLIAITTPDNLASQRVAHKIGMRFERDDYLGGIRRQILGMNLATGPA